MLLTACGTREGGEAGASAGSSVTLSDTSSAGSDGEGSSEAQSVGSANGTGGLGPFAIDFPPDKIPYCVTAPETVHDYVAPGSGDGTAITCKHGSRGGDGVLPAGVSIDPDTCAMVGEPPADRYGTWAVIVKATQSGVDVWVPYCVTQDQQPAGDALVEVSVAGSDGAALFPLHGTFTPDAPLTAGGSGDPRFRITDPARCGDACSYDYTFFASGSPFDLQAGPFIIDAMVVTVDGDAIGMGHGLALSGPPTADAAPDLSLRPWVFGFEVDYCFGENPSVCNGPPTPDPVARFRYTVVMSPE